MSKKIQYQKNKELDTVCWNLSKTVQEHRNHHSCGTWRNKESPVCPRLNQLCLTTTIFNLVKAVHNEPIDGFDGTSLCLQEVLQSLTACSDTPRNWTNTNQDSQKEMKPASWLSKLLAGAKIHHPYRKPDTHTFRQRSPNWKEDGSPRRASQHIPKSLKSPWTERRQTRGSYKQRAEWTSNEIILKSWLAGWWGYVRIVDMVRVVRMVKMVRMFSISSESGRPRS